MTNPLPIHTTPDGHRRPLGCLPNVDGRRLVTAGVLADVPESQWREFDLTAGPHPIAVKDQNGFGACNGHAAATALEWARFIAGMSHVDLSAWFVYAILCNGVDRGSVISEALELARDRGCAPESAVQYGIIDPRRLPRQAHDEAGRFKIEIGGGLEQGFRAMMSATQLEKPFNFSVRVGSSFDRMEDGTIGVDAGQINHAVVGGLGARKHPRFGWQIKGQNSWSTRWGTIGGYFWFDDRHVRAYRWWDAYTISATHDDPQDPTNPPEPK